MPGLTFLQAAAEAARLDPLGEKILLAPSYRIGRQWLDRLAETTGGVINMRICPLRRLMLDYAEPVLRARGQRLPTPEEKTQLMGQALAEVRAMRSGAEGYFTRLPPSHTLATTMLASVEELEAAGADRLHDNLGSNEKADELTALWRSYRIHKNALGLVGPDDVGEAAVLSLRRADGVPPTLLVPSSLWNDADRPGQSFLRAWPEERRRILPEEEAPPSATLRFSVADCVADEARAVFRHIQADGLTLDAVEVVCADTDGYLPALCAAALETFGGKLEDAPITSTAGLPGMYSRPVRLLTAWLAWLDGNLPPGGMADMIESGLLGEAWRKDAPKLSSSRLASRLRALPINAGPGDYRVVLGQGDDEAELTRGEAWLARLLPEILPLANGGNDLDRTDARLVLEAAAKLLRLGEECDGKLDAYARVALRESVLAWLPHCDWPGFDATAWLGELASSLRVMGLGPMPGRLHITDIHGGGHSGRKHTFILGLDDGRFPGGTRQDPVLLDKERGGLSRHLPVSRQRRERREAAMRRLLARVDGTLWLCRSARDSGRGRELFPAGILLDLHKSEDAKAESIYLRPRRAAECLTHRDDWLHALLPPTVRQAGEATLERWYPHLERGNQARAARLSTAFTAWDGRVPAAGDDFRRDNPVLSPTDLELLAACPLEFFFKKMLGIVAPDRYEPTPGRWLEGNERGSLLHDVFQTFLEEAVEQEASVTEAALPTHEKRLSRLLDLAVRRERRRKPPRDELAFLRDRNDLMDACVIFLTTEIGRQQSMRPLCLEAALGGAKADAPPWRRSEPIALSLQDGAVLRLKGRVDRIDRLHDGGGLRIWDYKTTVSTKFSPRDPFDGGRHLQPLLYSAMVEQAAAEAGSPEPVRAFSYFFPMPRDEGREIAYERAELREGMWIVSALSDLLHHGYFPFSTDKEDVRFSDYSAVYGDVTALAAAMRRKAVSDPALEGWARLRSLGVDDEKETDAE
ncbi:MAG: PD-(D/E)XK nuclease family protein [Planctomycetaceae bacterium]|nr:PD-(D/E)XK nuclease family protein [Planctomycetaceae bacterium]